MAYTKQEFGLPLQEKIIATKQIHAALVYKVIGNNIPRDSWSQLNIVLDIVNPSILARLIIQKNANTEYKIGEFNAILIRYEDLRIDDFYIGFYDTNLDDFWENFCEKKYGRAGFVWDNQTPMLRFSRLNFEHVLKSWPLVIGLQPQYLIITQDDDGWIDLQGKNELIDQDCLLIEEYKKQQKN